MSKNTLTADSVGKTFIDTDGDTLTISAMINNDRFYAVWPDQSLELLLDADGETLADEAYAGLGIDWEASASTLPILGTYYINIFTDEERGMRAGKLHNNASSAAAQAKGSTYLKTITIEI